MIVLHDFSVTATSTLEKHGDFTFGREYPVLAVRQTDLGTLFLIADNGHEFHWVDMDVCFLNSIEKKPGFGACYDEDFLAESTLSDYEEED